LLDKDLDLKLRVMRYLWRLGYLVRNNVELIKYNEQRRDLIYTDIDVFGVKYDGLFERKLIICDCRTGSSTSNSERILKLAGLVSFLDSDRAIYCRDKITESRYLEIGQKGKVQILSLDHLSLIEKSLKIDPNLFFGSFSKDIDKEYSIFDILKRNDKVTYEYLMVKNWFDPPNKRILSLCKTCDNIGKLNHLYEKSALAFLFGYTFSLLSTAIFDFSRNVLFIRAEEKSQIIKENLIGGKTQFTDKREILSSFYDFMQREIKTKYNQNYNVSKSGFIDNLIPPYTKYLVDLVIRICSDTPNAKHICRIMDIIAYEKFLHNNIVNKNVLGVFDNESINLAKDFIKFTTRANFIDKTLGTEFEVALNDIIWT
jgi:hypothetical protein